MEEFIIILIAGIISGFVSEIGGAGSLISLPMLIAIGVPPVVANGTNRIAVMSLYTAAFFDAKLRNKHKVEIVALKFSAPIIIGTVIGSYIANVISNVVAQWLIIALTIAMVLFTSFSYVPKDVTEQKDKFRPYAYIIMLLLGIYCGLFQSGMAYLMLFVMVKFIKVDNVRAEFIKEFLSMLATIASLIVFVIMGHINWKCGAILFIGGAIGGWFGSESLAKWDEKSNKHAVFVSILTSIVLLSVFMKIYNVKII